MDVLIVDDHVFVGDAIVSALNTMPMITGVDLVLGAEGAFAHIDANPDYRLIILDLVLEGMSGLDALGVLHARFPHIPVLVFSLDWSRDSIERALELGARGFLTKRAPMTELWDAVKVVLQGNDYLSAEVAQILGRKMARADSSTDAEPRLSPREVQIFRRLMQGHRISEIASFLRMAMGTVRVHAKSIITKFGVNSLAELRTCSRALEEYRRLMGALS